MPNIRQPRSGSMQYWPRKRAKRAYPRIRNAPNLKEAGLAGFAGYKVGMAHVYAIDSRKHSHTKGEEMAVPVTIIECPPVRIASARYYKKEGTHMVLKKEVFFQKKDKELERRINVPKKESKADSINPEEYDDITVLIYMQPKLTGIGKKKPELFEMPLGGSLKDRQAYILENVEKEITFTSIFKEGEAADIKSLTKGKGFQGPMRRFGISLRQSKSEKSIRNPGSLGPWRGQGHIMYRVAHAAKTGYNQRTEYNKQIIKIIEDPKEINLERGFLSYGKVKNPCVLIKGSVSGARKRTIFIQKPIRLRRQIELPTIQEIVLGQKE